VSEPRAAVDVGTNSVRLLVLDADGARVRRELTITRLGQGVDRTGRLDEAALRRTLDTIARYRELWRADGVDGKVRVAATSAVRDASNRDDFFAGVREVAGVDAEVITGELEAELAFTGATGAVHSSGPTAVIDVGGGSTELVVGDAEGVRGSVSLQLGCVRLTERELHDDPPTPQQIDAARAEVVRRLDEADAVLADRDVAIADVGTLIGVAGTATTLAALHLALDSYREDAIHGTRIPVSDLARLSGELLAMTVAQRAELGPVQPGREDVLHGGALVLATVLERYGLPELVVSEADGLDGLAASLA
jgi:exopolyphosphatase / guanosine-5'-triphosphate,3'-diphosphate pyrophosphatase